MKVICLTGGIASGKSTITQVLQDQGAVVISADKIAHEVIEPGKPAWEEIIEFFGPQVLNGDKQINRAKLGGIVFDDLECLQKLNRITHPRIIEAFKDSLRNIRRKDPDAIVIMEIPLLYETNLEKLCDGVWTVWVDKETQIQRLIKRDGLNRDNAVKRINAQMLLDEKARRADIVIDNSNSLEETKKAAAKYFNEILSNY